MLFWFFILNKIFLSFWSKTIIHVIQSYDGSVIAYDIATSVGIIDGNSNNGERTSKDDDNSMLLASLSSLAACATVDLFDECVNSVSIHPFLSSLIAVGTGERRNSDHEQSNDNDIDNDNNNIVMQSTTKRKNIIPLESLSILKMIF